MRLPVIQGVIRRRLLVNFRVDPAVMQAQLPSRLRPKLHDGHAIAGICLIRLEAVRPRMVPAILGLSSENAAHRIAVRWDENGGEREGVFIPRRDTDSTVNHVGGGRVFPGEHHHARFTVEERGDRIDLAMWSDDGAVSVHVRGRTAAALPATSTFASLADASAFFEAGSLGYSVTRDPGRLDGLELRTRAWRVEPLDVSEVRSSWFGDPTRFPSGSVEFDCALVMRNVEHEWRSADDLHVDVPGAA
jgi:uncharacterized protein YqjF (DUF2071 family)